MNNYLMSTSDLVRFLREGSKVVTKQNSMTPEIEVERYMMHAGIDPHNDE